MINSKGTQSGLAQNSFKFANR